MVTLGQHIICVCILGLHNLNGSLSEALSLKSLDVIKKTAAKAVRGSHEVVKSKHFSRATEKMRSDCV